MLINSYDSSVDENSDDGGEGSSQSFFSRWQSFCGICLFVSVVGTTYAFGVYSQLLRSELGYTQDSLDFIASVGNNGYFLEYICKF
jgi:hypothetical protein